MEGTEIVEVVASSFAAIMKDSLNAPFRKECLLLLKVSNNKDAQNTMSSLLSKRILKSLKEPDFNAPLISMNFHPHGPKGEDQMQLGEMKPCQSDVSKAEDFTPVTTNSPSSAVVDASGDKVQQFTQDVKLTDSLSDEETQLDWETSSSLIAGK